MIVLDILLFCNLVLFAVCAVRSPRAKGTRIDDLVDRAKLSPVAPAPRPLPLPAPAAHDNVVPFPSAADLARRRARAMHPSRTAHPSAGLRHHPSGLG